MVGTLHEDQYTFLIVTHSFLLRMRNVSEKRCTENKKRHIFLFNNFPKKSCPLWDNVVKYFIAGHATDTNMAHTHCTLDT